MKTKLILFFVASAYLVSAQSIDYKVVSNEPPQTPRLSLNLELMQLDMMQNTLDALSMNAAVWGHYEILPERVGAQFLYRHSWFAFGKLGEKNFAPNVELELGGYYVLFNNLKTKSTKVTLKKEYSGTTYSTNYKGESTYSYTTTETYLMIPSEKKKILMGRGGIYRKSHGNGTGNLGDAYSFSNNPEYLHFSSTGFYVGLNSRTLTSVFIDTKEYGIQFNSIGRDVYFDLLVLPSNKFKDFDGNDITTVVKDYTESGPLGFRFGYKLFQIDKSAKTGKFFGLNGTFEFGKKPYTGWFISAGIGMTILK